MALIAVGGFQHETNTFAPTRADYRAFEAGGGWPGVQFGAAIAPAVEGLGDGNFTGTGPFYRGFHLKLGPMALLRSREAPGVRVVLASKKCQTADQEMFRHLGLEPKTQRLIALKSSVHFRADFQPIAKEVLVVRAPGPALADPADFPWTRLRHGMRLGPLGPAFKGA